MLQLPENISGRHCHRLRHGFAASHPGKAMPPPEKPKKGRGKTPAKGIELKRSREKKICFRADPQVFGRLF
ncbi:MAG: hypothetical protein VZR11_04605 [Succinimonas sp.]|nr:hypothetical protein [Succinimonas sp.]